MKQKTPKIAIVSTFPPTQCGIATYSNDLSQSLVSSPAKLQIVKVEINTGEYQFGQSVLYINSDKLAEYYDICKYINSSDIDLVDIQHEFKLYGNPDGENIIPFLKRIQKPVVTTLHTVFAKLNTQRENVFVELIKRSDKLFVFSDDAKNFIVEKYSKPNDQIEVTPHGVPAIEFKYPEEISARTPSQIVFISSGHMRNTKGYDIALKALHLLKEEGLNFRFLILGANHPKNETSQLYRDYLINLVTELNLTDQVTFINEYLENTRLIQYIQSADICLLPYTGEAQSSSGVLSLMIACGRPVVSTPFQFASYYIKSSMGIVADSFCRLPIFSTLQK